MVRATWDEALSLAAARLQGIKKEFGPHSLGVLTSAKGTNEENYLLMKLARAALEQTTWTMWPGSAMLQP